MACGIAVHQWAEADLVGDAGAGEALGDDPDYQAKHGGPAVEALHSLQLVAVDLFGGAAGEPGAGGVVTHQPRPIWERMP